MSHCFAFCASLGEDSKLSFHILHQHVVTRSMSNDRVSCHPLWQNCGHRRPLHCYTMPLMSCWDGDFLSKAPCNQKLEVSLLDCLNPRKDPFSSLTEPARFPMENRTIKRSGVFGFRSSVFSLTEGVVKCWESWQKCFKMSQYRALPRSNHPPPTHP